MWGNQREGKETLTSPTKHRDHKCLMVQERRQRQKDCYKFQTILVYKESEKPARGYIIRLFKRHQSRWLIQEDPE